MANAVKRKLTKFKESKAFKIKKIIKAVAIKIERIINFKKMFIVKVRAKNKGIKKAKS